MRKVVKLCMNCDGELLGAFCSSCGQKDQNIRLSFFGFFGEWLSEMLSVDGKIWRTLLMALRPGYLAKAYIEGRRNQFISPLKLFLFSVVLAVFVLSGQTKDVDFVSVDNDAEVELEDLSSKTGFERKTKEKLKEFVSLDPTLRSVKTRAEILEAIPWILTLLLPISALLLKVFFYRRFYLEHLVVALNLHAVLLLWSSFGLGISSVYNVKHLWCASLYIGAFALFTVLTLKSVYQKTLREFWWKLPMLTLCYGCLALIGVAATFFLAFWRI